jgi:hypothetical protein
MEKEILWQINPNLRVTYNVRYSWKENEVNVELFLCVIKSHVMKTYGYGGVAIALHIFSACMKLLFMSMG